jgi:hypothetical protein
LKVFPCFSSRLYCTPKALWKLNWFLRDFGYDNELLDRTEVDDKLLRVPAILCALDPHQQQSIG